MAYNPFDFFRTNQKIFFSIITAIIMFVFVLSIGGGKSDFFNWFPEMLRSGRSSGEVIAVVDGSDVKESKLYDLRRSRTMANQFMLAATQKAGQNLKIYATDSVKKLPGENRQRIESAMNFERMAMSIAFQEIQRMGMQFDERMMRLIPQFYPQAIQSGYSSLSQLLAQPNLKPDERDAANAARKYLALESIVLSQNPTYFVDMPNRNGRDSIEFMLWLKKADSLGIRFRNDDVETMLNQEFLQFPADDREKLIAQMMAEQRQNPISRDKLYEALSNEFRVRTAMTTVLGPVETRGIESLNAFDLFEFFRKETSSARYGVIAFPVGNFLYQVQGEPNDQELKKLFDQTRKIEPNPNEARPGIAEPRRLKIQFLEATGKEPFYTTAGADALVKTELNEKIAGALSVPFGANTFGLLATAAGVVNPETALDRAYKRYKADESQKLTRRWFPGNFSDPNNVPGDSSLVNLTTIFSAVGLGAASPVGTPGGLLGVPGSMIGVAESLEYKARLTHGFPLFAPPLLDGLAGLVDVSTAWAIQGMGLPQSLPLAAVKQVLAKEMNELMRYKVAQTDLQNFHDECLKLATPKTKDQAEQAAKDAQEYIAKFAGTQPWKDKDGKDQMGRGLKITGSNEFRDQYSMLNDPGLAPLVTLWKPTNSKEYKDPASFAQPFYTDFDPLTGQPAAATGLFKPILDPRAFGQVPTPNDLSPVYLAWRTEEQAAESARVMDDKAKAKLTAIWKRQKAKEMAKAAADELATKFDGKLGSNVVEIAQKLTSARAEFANAKFTTPQQREKVAQFEIPDIDDKLTRGVGGAVIAQQMNRQTGEPGFALQSFQLLPSVQIPYANPKMAGELIANRNKPLSTAFTMMDTPESTVYVAVLEDRSEESTMRFNNLVYNPKQPSQVTRGITEQFLAVARQNARQLAVEMLKAEYGYEKENPELDKKFSESSN